MGYAQTPVAISPRDKKGEGLSQGGATSIALPEATAGGPKGGFKDIYLLYIGLAVGVVCAIIGILSYNTTIMWEIRPGEDQAGMSTHPEALLDWMCFAMLAVMMPYGIVASRHLSKIAGIEKRLPDFLRDVAEAGRFGMVLPEAIIVAAKGRYGELTDEIKHMASQLEWGVPVSHALKLFEERIKTPLTSRVVSIIIKANEAGGNVADVLTMVAHDTREAQLSEEQRRISMGTYVAVIVIAFGVFLVTIYIMAATFLPQMITAGGALSASSASANVAGASSVAISTQYIPVVFLAFFVAIVAHAVGDGIMAGIIQSGKFATGMAYASFLLVGGWAFMRFAVPLLVIPMTGGG